MQPCLVRVESDASEDSEQQPFLRHQNSFPKPVQVKEFDLASEIQKHGHALAETCPIEECPIQVTSSSRCRHLFKVCCSCTLLLMLVLVGMFICRNWVFLLTASGYQWNYFVWCQATQAMPSSFGMACPPVDFNVPRGACSFDGEVDDQPLLLLTADGLSSPEAQSAFSTLLSDAATRHRRATKQQERRSTDVQDADLQGHEQSQRPKHLDLGNQGVVYICDSNYDAHRLLPQDYNDCISYCHVRQRELNALGASKVACLMLDPHARHELLASARDPLPTLEYNFTDHEMSQLLAQAAGIFVEGGQTFYLLSTLRRPLHLEGSLRKVSASFGDLVRARVEAGTLVYVGVSSGSIVAGETASVAQVWSDKGADLVDWNFTGLQLLRNCVFFPHFHAHQEKFLREYEAGLSTSCPWCRVMAVPQCQPVTSGLSSSESSQQMDYICPS